MELPAFNLTDTLMLTAFTLILYQSVAYAQQKWQLIWLNPMLLSILIIIPYLLYNKIDYPRYYASTQIFNYLLEPATVALGYPLYQQLVHIKRYWKHLVSILALSIIIVIIISFSMTMLLINEESIAIALSLKSVTTPIGITLTEQLKGDSSITALAIMIAGFSGSLLGPSWLRFLNLKSDMAIGLAIGTGSHVIGSIILSKDLSLIHI